MSRKASKTERQQDRASAKRLGRFVGMEEYVNLFVPAKVLYIYMKYRALSVILILLPRATIHA
jgi:hypothetical protein